MLPCLTADLPGAFRRTRAQKERRCSEDRKPREQEPGRIQNQLQCELCDVSRRGAGARAARIRGAIRRWDGFGERWM